MGREIQKATINNKAATGLIKTKTAPIRFIATKIRKN